MYLVGILNIVLFSLSEIGWVYLLNNAVYYNLSMTYALAFPLVFLYLVTKLNKKFSFTFKFLYSLIGLLATGFNGWIGYELIARADWTRLLV